jgi:hypothetical protein
MSTEVSAFMPSVPTFVGEVSNPEANAMFFVLLLLLTY